VRTFLLPKRHRRGRNNSYVLVASSAVVVIMVALADGRWWFDMADVGGNINHQAAKETGAWDRTAVTSLRSGTIALRYR
jgi:hypothetical protein